MKNTWTKRKHMKQTYKQRNKADGGDGEEGEGLGREVARQREMDDESEIHIQLNSENDINAV